MSRYFAAFPSPAVKIERYYFIPSSTDAVSQPPRNSTPPPAPAVAPAVGEVIIREYFVMDRPVQLNEESTPQESKLKAPAWSGKFEVPDKTPSVEPVVPPVEKSKEAVPEEKARQGDGGTSRKSGKAKGRTGKAEFADDGSAPCRRTPCDCDQVDLILWRRSSFLGAVIPTLFSGETNSRRLDKPYSDTNSHKPGVARRQPGSGGSTSRWPSRIHRCNR